MFVLCPHCQFLVAIESASGQPPLRCPRCNAPLLPTSAQASVQVSAAVPPRAIDALVEAVIDAEIAAMTQTRRADAHGSDDGPVAAPTAAAPPAAAQQQHGDTGTTDTPVATVELAAPVITASAATPPSGADTAAAGPASAPGFVRRQRARHARTPHTARWMDVAVACLSLLLVLQLLLADRAELARDARWRPALMLLCNALRCTLPPWREPGAFTLLDRDVRPRPDMPGVLRVTATFRNDARWPQPWPALRLTLSDLDGRSVGARAFAPREYLGGKPTQGTVASGQSVMLSMDVLEPGPQIVAFTFDFR